MNRLIKNSLRIGFAAVPLLSACSDEQPVHSVDDLMRNEVLLEATLVRCTQNRAQMRYEPECVNVREAVKLIEVQEEKARREQLEAQSKRKREALRRTQQAVAEARRRASERERMIETGGVIVEFEETPPAEPGTVIVGSPSETPTVTPAESVEFAPAATSGTVQAVETPAADPASVGEPVAENEVPAVEPVSDIEAVRQELGRRGDEDGN